MAEGEAGESGGEASGVSGIHLTVARQLSHGYDRTTCVETWEGPYDECLAKAAEHTPGLPDVCKDIEDAWPNVTPEPTVFCSSVNVRRGVGNIGTCAIVYQALYNLAVSGLEITVVEKPIRSWKANDGDDAPDLGQIKQWEEQKEENYAAYSAYKYDGTNEMTGNTKKLAEMIFKGIESYSEYVPVITLTITYYNAPGLPDPSDILGKQVTPEVPDVCTDSLSNLASYVLMKDHWVGTADRETGNNDGTFTRVIQWSGFDDVEDDLYPEGGSGEGGGGES